MGNFLQLVTANWYSILLTIYTVLQFLISAIANSLPAPTKDSSWKYVFWFQFVNYCALNWKRASSLAKIEDSPNFVDAAEAYMKTKLEGGKP
jgi:hypothetical protein